MLPQLVQKNRTEMFPNNWDVSFNVPTELQIAYIWANKFVTKINKWNNQQKPQQKWKNISQNWGNNQHRNNQPIDNNIGLQSVYKITDTFLTSLYLQNHNMENHRKKKKKTLLFSLKNKKNAAAILSGRCLGGSSRQRLAGSGAGGATRRHPGEAHRGNGELCSNGCLGDGPSFFWNLNRFCLDLNVVGWKWWVHQYWGIELKQDGQRRLLQNLDFICHRTVEVVGSLLPCDEAKPWRHFFCQTPRVAVNYVAVEAEFRFRLGMLETWSRGIFNWLTVCTRFGFGCHTARRSSELFATKPPEMHGTFLRMAFHLWNWKDLDKCLSSFSNFKPFLSWDGVFCTLVQDTNVTATGEVDALSGEDTTALLVALSVGCVGAFFAGLCCAWKAGVVAHWKTSQRHSCDRWVVTCARSNSRLPNRKMAVTSHWLDVFPVFARHFSRKTSHLADWSRATATCCDVTKTAEEQPSGQPSRRSRSEPWDVHLGPAFSQWFHRSHVKFFAEIPWSLTERCCRSAARTSQVHHHQRHGEFVQRFPSNPWRNVPTEWNFQGFFSWKDGCHFLSWDFDGIILSGFCGSTQKPWAPEGVRKPTGNW